MKGGAPGLGRGHRADEHEGRRLTHDTDTSHQRR
jgi:hypothetical protein